jgi:hypothetical protein
VFITPRLKEHLISKKFNHFDRSIIYLLRFLEEWDNKAFVGCQPEEQDFVAREKQSKYQEDILFNELLFKSKYPIILGTKDEVIERRKKIKGLQGDVCQTKIELIKQISSLNLCDSFDEIYEELDKLQSLCEVHDRYAFYIPEKCDSPVPCYPLSSNADSDVDLDIMIKPINPITLNAGYIMMPYDLSEHFSFTPKFYQALCHELFHAQVINKFRGSKRINEGLPELYSELCYYQFVEEFIEDYFGDVEIFKSEYMNFKNISSYKSYYLYVREKLGYKDEYQIEEEFNEFSKFISQLLYDSESQIMDEFDRSILNCKEKTPYWEYPFEKACGMINLII